MPLRINARIRNVASVLTVAFVAACASGPSITTSKDPAADFSAYRSFGFMQPLGTDRDAGRTLLSGWLIASTTRELKARGLRSVGNNPDLLVNFYSGMQTRTSGASTATFTPAVRNYGGWEGSPLRSLSSSTITEGTLVVDLVDRRTNRLVWSGRAEERVTEAMQDDLPGTIDGLIAELFNSFP